MGQIIGKTGVVEMGVGEMGVILQFTYCLAFILEILPPSDDFSWFSAAACGQLNFTGTSGSIQSPNYPNNYPDHLFCRYQIFAPAGTKVKLRHSFPGFNAMLFAF